MEIKYVIIKNLILFFILFTTVQCKQSSSTDKFYKEVTQSEFFNKKITIGELQYTFKLRPKEFIALNEAITDNKKNIDKNIYEKRVDDLKDCIVLLIEHGVSDGSISPLKYKISNASDYEQRLMYYQNQAANDLFMICNKDTMKPVSYLYENNMDLSPVNTIIAVFEYCDDDISELQFQFNDRVFNNYYINQKFNLKELTNLPKIKL